MATGDGSPGVTPHGTETDAVTERSLAEEAARMTESHAAPCALYSHTCERELAPW